MKEFRLNNYITLMLEDGKTNIYVDGELFEQCKFLLLNIPIDKISSFDEINSVDEAAENLSKKMEKRYFPWGENEMGNMEIPSEVEFWAHCSNLQVWSEFDYDTNLIHSNLAFPLLKKLTEAGDSVAKRVFKEEIAKRLESGYWPVIEFLMKKEYTDFLSREEFLQCILEDEDEVQFLLEIEKKNDITFYLEKELSGEYNNFIIENNHIVGLDILNLDVSEALPSIGNLKFLKSLYLMGKKLEVLPDSIGELERLEMLNLVNNQLTEFPRIIKKLKLLNKLNLGSNNIKIIPKEITSLKNLKKLRLYDNNISEIPSMESLNSLILIDLSNNPINTESKALKELKNRAIKIII